MAIEYFQYLFPSYKIAGFVAWLLLTVFMYVKGNLKLVFCQLSLISVISMIGYVLLVFFGVLGAGFQEGLVLPDYDAFIDPFLFFLLGIPIIILMVWIFYSIHIYRSKKFQLLVFLHVAASSYVLWSVLEFHIGVIASI